ncbi:MAG: DUF4169 family protein [Nioella sp.]
MAAPVNLNQYRKQKARAERKARADENAVKHGRSKAAKARDSDSADKAARDHDAHRRDDTDGA